MKEPSVTRIACALAIMGGWSLWSAIWASYGLFFKPLVGSLTISGSVPMTLLMTVGKWTLNLCVFAVGGSIALIAVEALSKNSAAKCLAYVTYLFAWSLLGSVLLWIMVFD